MCKLPHAKLIQQFCALDYKITSENNKIYFNSSVSIQLKRNLEKLIQSHPHWEEENYKNYFIALINDKSQPALKQQIAHLHLVAFLNLTRRSVVKNFIKKYSFLGFIALFQCFDEINAVIYNRSWFQKKINQFCDNNESRASFKTYMYGTFFNVLREKFRLESAYHILCCDVDLRERRTVKNKSNKIRTCLEQEGLRSPTLDEYLFAWECFVSVYLTQRLNPTQRNPGSRWPDAEKPDFEEAAQVYNANKTQSYAPLEIAYSPEIQSSTMQKWMEEIAIFLRPAVHCTEFSLDHEEYEKEYGETSDFFDLVETDFENNSFPEQVNITIRSKLEEIDRDIEQCRSKIPPDLRQLIMPLCYSHDLQILIQPQFATLAGVDQGTISRFIKAKYERPIFEHFKKYWRNIQGTSLEQWLQSYVDHFSVEALGNPNSYNLIQNLLLDCFEKIPPNLKFILKCYLIQNKNLTIPDFDDAGAEVQQAKASLHEEFKRTIEEELKRACFKKIKEFYQLKTYLLLIQLSLTIEFSFQYKLVLLLTSAKVTRDVDS